MDTHFMVISDNGARARAVPTGTTNEGMFQQRPGPSRTARAIDEIGGPHDFNTIRGAGPAPGGHDVRRGSGDYRGGVSPFSVSCGRHQGQGEVKQQYAHIGRGADVLDVRASSRRHDRGVNQCRCRVSACEERRRRRRASDTTTRTSRGWSAGHLPRRNARGLPLARAIVHRCRHGVRTAITAASSPTRFHRWSCTKVEEDFAENRTSRGHGEDDRAHPPW